MGCKESNQTKTKWRQEAGTKGPSVSSQALYHWATVPCPLHMLEWHQKVKEIAAKLNYLLRGIFQPFWSWGQGPFEFGR